MKIDPRFFGDAESPEEAWDPDEYTAAFHGQLKSEKADGAREIENEVKEDKRNYIEADVGGAEPLGISGTDTISTNLSR